MNSIVSTRIGSGPQGLRNRVAAFLGEYSSPHRQSSHQNNAPLWADFPQDKANEANASHIQRALCFAVTEIVDRIRSTGWRAYLIGGTLRDLMSVPIEHGRLSVWPRDVDIIVAGPSLDDLANLFRDVIGRRTRFGGLHLVKHIVASCEVHFDVWPLHETWAFRQYGIRPDIEEFPATAFMNLDAIAIELFRDQAEERRIYEHGFFSGIKNRLIDLNFEPNPFPSVCAIRSLLMSARLQYALSPTLAEYVVSQTHSYGVDSLIAAQTSHYGQVRAGRDELLLWIETIEKQLAAGSERIEVVVSRTRQTQLWHDYPKEELNSTRIEGRCA